jgi:hypothetical protein
MVLANLYVGWAAILIGLAAGATIGLFFHSETWLGGYGSWPRRMLRLVHISLVGTGLLNVAFGVTSQSLGIDKAPVLASVLFIVGAVTMPTVCLLSAWRRAARHLFFIPVLSLVVATADFIFRGLVP